MKRLEKLLSLPAYQGYLEENQKREKERKFCVHDWQHFLDVARITYILLLEQEDKDKLLQEFANWQQIKELVYVAAFCHDIGKWQQYDTGEDHALVSARLARALLVEVGFSSQEGEIICQAIEEHRTASNPETTLGIYLKKADKLSRLCYSCQAKQECYKGQETPTSCCYLVY